MDMIRHDVPFYDFALFLFGERVEDLTKGSSDFPIEYLSAAFGNEDDVVGAIPAGMR